MVPILQPRETDHQLNTLTNMVNIVAEKRSEVKVHDRKVDCCQQENRERFDRLDKNFSAIKGEVAAIKDEVASIKTTINLILAKFA